MVDRSPYELVLGERLELLHPRLRAYFGAIPSGSIGVGSGVFDRVGTPRRWLWPVLRVLARQNVLFPVWAEAVTFKVENRAVVDRDGCTAVSARREFRLADGDRTMIDSIAAEVADDGFRLTDILGPDRRLSADLEATVTDGELHLESTRVTIRLGKLRVRLPRMIAPVVRLRERFDDGADRQHVDVTVDLPIIGRIYEYSGAFVYAIEAGSTTQHQENRG